MRNRLVAVSFAFLAIAISCPPIYAKTVAARGVGINREVALRDAYRMAVEQGVGTFISSKTITKNYQLINDSILSKSRGYIRDVKVLKEGYSRVTYWVEIEAEVDFAAIKRVLVKQHFEIIDGDLAYKGTKYLNEHKEKRARERLELFNKEFGSMKYPQDFIHITFSYEFEPGTLETGYITLEMKQVMIHTKDWLLDKFDRWVKEAAENGDKYLSDALHRRGYGDLREDGVDQPCDYRKLHLLILDKKGRIIYRATENETYDWSEDPGSHRGQRSYSNHYSSYEATGHDQLSRCKYYFLYDRKSFGYRVPLWAIRKAHTLQAALVH